MQGAVSLGWHPHPFGVAVAVTSTPLQEFPPLPLPLLYAGKLAPLQIPPPTPALLQLLPAPFPSQHGAKLGSGAQNPQPQSVQVTVPSTSIMHIVPSGQRSLALSHGSRFGSEHWQFEFT